MRTPEHHLLTYSHQGWTWEHVRGGVITPCDAPPVQSNVPVLALLPDHFFFYVVQPLGALRGRAARDLSRMTIAHSLPALRAEQQTGVIQLGPDELLTYRSHPALGEFLEEHRPLLDRATALTTEFVLAKAAARAQQLTAWIWISSGAPRALIHQEHLHYFRGGEPELQRRLGALGITPEPPRLDRRLVVATLAEHDIRLERLRFHLAGTMVDQSPAACLIRKVAVMGVVAGLLLCLGQGLRLMSMTAQTDMLEHGVASQYERVLGQNLGEDPYGRLLSRLEQAKRGAGGGLDMLGLLGLLSEHAPKGVFLDSFNFTASSGTMKGQISSYDDLDTMLKALSASPRFQFVLDKASSLGKSIEFSITVRTRQ